MKHNVKWFASLSNGETVYEDKGAFIEEEGALSPWWKFQSYLSNNTLSVTSFGLYTDSGQRWLLPSVGKNSKFLKYSLNQKRPVSYNAYRQVEGFLGEAPTILCVAEARYEDNTIIQIFVDNDNPAAVWFNLSNI